MSELGNMDGLRERLRAVSEFDRKLLAQIVELAYREPRHERAMGVAYLPELYETSGLDVDDSYTLLGELQKAGLIEVENEYPFQDVKPRGDIFAALQRFCAEKQIALRDVLVDLHFDLLG